MEHLHVAKVYNAMRYPDGHTGGISYIYQSLIVSFRSVNSLIVNYKKIGKK